MKNLVLILFLFILLILVCVYSVYYGKDVIEKYTNLGDLFYNAHDNQIHDPHTTYGNFPSSEEQVLLQDTYPITGTNGVSTDEARKMWWHYPIFKVGSYAQVTNNLKYPNNPDNGKCTPSELCGALYKEYQSHLNEAEVLAPVKPGCGARVNYYRTPPNLLNFRNDTENILY